MYSRLWRVPTGEVEKTEEEAKIAFAHTVVHPGTVMIEASHTTFADRAVFASSHLLHLAAHTSARNIEVSIVGIECSVASNVLPAEYSRVGHTATMVGEQCDHHQKDAQ